uniref:Serpin domain-containing protein n=1 Tax=Panagrolaimus davidi TaxID=227884 RepID=A0A914P651_9BILA
MDISNEFQLKESLQKLGMKDAFEEDICNLTGMIKEPSKLDKIIHKTVMKTDEYGTEASAATSIYDLRCGGRIERFKADHPFLFFITTTMGDNSFKLFFFENLSRSFKNISPKNETS